MKRNLIGMLAALTVAAAWLAPAALAHRSAPAHHPGGLEHIGNCPPGSAGGPYCECPPQSHGRGCECPPGSAGGDYCECPPPSHQHHGCEPGQGQGKAGGIGHPGRFGRPGSGDNQGNEDHWWMGDPGGGAWRFGFPTAGWFRLAGAP